MEEIWKPLKDIIECGDNYEISNMGKVRNIKTNKVRNPSRDKDGYLIIILYKNNKPKTCRIHRLVAMAFIENKYNKPLVNHKDGNKENNNFENLEWATSSENNKHSCDNGLNKGYDMNGSNHPSSKLNEEKVLKIRELYSTGKYSYRKLAKMYDVDYTMIASIIKRKNWTHI